MLSNSNTTLVKVKSHCLDFSKRQPIHIQIQHLLKLNNSALSFGSSPNSIQIQHLLKLNA